MTLTRIHFYEPKKILVADVAGRRWMSDHYILVPPVNTTSAGLPVEPGYYELVEMIDPDDGPEYVKHRNTNLGPRTVQTLLATATPRSHDRDDSVALVAPIWHASGAGAPLVEVDGVYLNVVLTEVAAFIAGRPVDGYGVAGPSHPTSLYAGDEFVGLQMPVLVTGDVIRIGAPKGVTA